MCVNLYDMSDVLSVRLPHDLALRLERLATTTHRARSFYVREALEAHIERLEWEQRLLTEAQDARSGRVPARAAGDVYAELGVAAPSADEMAAALADVE